MRVLIINSMFVSAVYRRCAEELGKLPGVELTMLTTDYWYMNGRVMPLDPIPAEAPYHTVIGRGAWRGKENRGFYVSGLAKAFKVSRPDVIYLMEEPFSVFTLEILQLRALYAPDVPVVYFTWNNLSLEKFDYRPGFFYRNAAKYALPKMQYALTANTDGIGVLRGSGVTYPVRSIGYGVDTERYTVENTASVTALRQLHHISSDDRVIGYVGRMIHMKGIDLLIKAFASLRSREKNVKLLLVGSGDWQETLLEQARVAGIWEDVRHVPTVPHAEVPNYMHLLDILVLPSRRVGMWAEQFGRVMVEAMAAGKIVIGSTSGAIPEVIGDAGFTFEENDAADLERVIEHTLHLREEERKDLLSKAWYRSNIHYSWKRFAEDSYSALRETYERVR